MSADTLAVAPAVRVYRSFPRCWMPRKVPWFKRNPERILFGQGRIRGPWEPWRVRVRFAMGRLACRVVVIEGGVRDA